MSDEDRNRDEGSAGNQWKSKSKSKVKKKEIEAEGKTFNLVMITALNESSNEDERKNGDENREDGENAKPHDNDGNWEDKGSPRQIGDENQEGKGGTEHIDNDVSRSDEGNRSSEEHEVAFAEDIEHGENTGPPNDDEYSYGTMIENMRNNQEIDEIGMSKYENLNEVIEVSTPSGNEKGKSKENDDLESEVADKIGENSMTEYENPAFI